MTDFSVIIPTYKDWERLALCVDRLLIQESEGLQYEIIIVDNELQHAPPDIFDKYSEVRLIHEPEPGSYTARNSGAKIAKGDVLAFTDADCLPKTRWLQNARDTFKKKKCDLIGGRIDMFKPKGGGEWAYIYETYTSFRQDKNVPQGKSVTANLFVKKDVFLALNGFDSDMKSGGDWDFTLRAVSDNYVMVYDEDVVVQHPTRQSVREILKKQKRFAAWGYLNAKNKYGHSGLRIIGSTLLRGTPSAFKIMSYSNRMREKIILLIISLQGHFYKLVLQTLFLVKVINPEKIRE